MRRHYPITIAAAAGMTGQTVLDVSYRGKALYSDNDQLYILQT